MDKSMQKWGKNSPPPEEGYNGPAAHDIANRLKSFYASVEAEPVPDHLLSLLEKLDEAERARNANGEC